MLDSRGSVKSSKTFATVLVLLMIAGLLCGVLYLGRRSDRLPPSTPAEYGQTNKGPRIAHDLNPEEPAHIVGLQTCARCHPRQAEALGTSGHSRTFTPTSESEVARSLDGKTFVDPERKYSFLYRFDPQNGLSVSIPGKIDRQFPLQYALGSGDHAVTFLGLVANRNSEGALQTLGVEHRVSVFPHSKQSRLSLTPGHAHRKAEHEVTHFGKVEESASLDRCIECHTTSGTIEKLAVVNLRANVTCESCHGPGSKHVAAVDRGMEAPGHLNLIPGSYSGLEQIQKCGNCHRLPDMVDASRQRRENETITRFQPVGMQLSRCFKESAGRLTCTTCHDPHHGVSHDRSHYVAQCVKCHQAGTAGHVVCPVSPATDCMRCHMPAVPLVNEVSFTDHWIRVRDERDPRTTQPVPLPKKKRE